MNVTELPLFSYGSPQTRPKESDYCQYGLYNPVADCFVLVHDNLIALTVLSLLFSSRYVLIVCRLDMATNFNPTLVDNTVCLDWTMANASDSSFTKFPQFNVESYVVKELKNKSIELGSTDLLMQNQSYLMYALRCVEFLERNTDRFNKLELHQLVDIPFIPSEINYPGTRLRKAVYNTIYKTFDFVQAKDIIKQITSKYDNPEFSILINQF
jgi:hypothetical protein